MAKINRKECELELGEDGAEKFVARLDFEDLETIEDQCGIGIFALANLARTTSVRVSHVRIVLKAALARSGEKLTDAKLADLIYANVPLAVRAAADLILTALMPKAKEEAPGNGD